MRGTPQGQREHQCKSTQEHVSPPGGHATETQEASGLGRDAVGCHELLLLAERVQKAKGVRAKADDGHDRQQQKRPTSPNGDARTLTPCRRSEHHERQHEPCRGLHAYPDDEQSGCRPEVCSVRRNGCAPCAHGGHRRFGCRQRQRPGQDQQHERVVV
jgi:hypothetical protein